MHASHLFLGSFILAGTSITGQSVGPTKIVKGVMNWHFKF